MSCSQNNRMSHIEYPRSCCQVPQTFHNCYQPVLQAQPQCYQHPIQKPSCCQIQNCQSYGCQTNFNQNQSCMSCPIQPNQCPQVSISNHHEAKSFNCPSSLNHIQDAHLHIKNIDNLSHTTPQPGTRMNEDKHSPIQTHSQNPNDISIVEKRILELEKNRYKMEKELLKGELRRRDELRKYRKMFAQSNENKNQLEQEELHENRAHQLRQSQKFVNREILLTDNEQKNSRGNSYDGQVYNKFQQTPVGSNFRSQNEFSTANNAVYELSFLPQNLFNQNKVQKDQYINDENQQNFGYQQNINLKNLHQLNDQNGRQQTYLMANNFPIQNQREQQYSNTQKQQFEELPVFSSNQFITVNQSLQEENIQPNQFIQRNIEPTRLPVSENIPDQMLRNEILYDSQGRQVLLNLAYQNSQNNSNFKIPQQYSFNSQNEAQILQNLKKQREVYLKSQNLQKKEIQLSSGYSIKSSITDQEANDHQRIITEPSKIIQPFSYQEKGRVKRGSQSPQKNNNFNYKTTQFYNNQFAYQQPNFQNQNISNQDPMIEDQSKVNQQIFIKNQEQEKYNQFQNFQNFDQKYQMNIIENSRLNSSKKDEKKQISFVQQLPNIQYINQNQMNFPHQNQSQNSSVYERTTPQISQQQFLEFHQNKNFFQSFDNIVQPSNGFIKDQDINSQKYALMSKPIQSMIDSIIKNDRTLKSNQQMFETGSHLQIFDQSKDQGYFLQNRHQLSQQPVDNIVLNSQSMQNHEDLLQQNQVAQIFNESHQNQSNFSLNNKIQSQEFEQDKDLIQQNQKIYFENNETFNGSKQFIPLSNYQSQNFEFINNLQNFQDSINQREPFIEKNELNKNILNISHMNSIQIIPENNIFQNLQNQQKEFENIQDQQLSQQNKKLSTQDSGEVNQESENIKLPKFKMKELRSRSKDQQKVHQYNENPRNNKVLEKSISRERCRENDGKPLKVLTVKLVNEKNRSHRGRHQQNQKHSPKSKSRFHLNCAENVRLKADNLQKEQILVVETPKSDINLQQFQDFRKQQKILSQSSENFYMLKLNQQENIFPKNDQSLVEKMNKNEKISNKENEKCLINQIEQSQMNTMTEAELPPKLKLEIQKMNSVSDIQRNHLESQQFFENLPYQLNEIKNLLMNVPENLQNNKVQKDLEEIYYDKNLNLGKNQLENFQYFGNFQSANLPQKKRNILLNQSSENSIKQSKQKHFDNKLSTSEEMPLREKQKDESNLEFNKIIIQSLQNLENCMKQFQQSDQNKKSVQSKEVAFEIPAQDQNSVSHFNNSGNGIANQLSNQDSLQNINQQYLNQQINIKNQQSFQNINEANLDSQNNQFQQLNSQKIENLYFEKNMNNQINQNEAQLHQLLQNSSCKSTYTKEKLKNNLQYIEDQNCQTDQNNQNIINHRSDEKNIEQDQNFENPSLSNCNKNQGLNETLQKQNFTKILCENPQQLNQNYQEINEQNNQIEGLLNYVFQPQNNLSEDGIDQPNTRQSFGGTNKKNESSSYKKEQQNRTVTISEIVDCSIQQINNEIPVQNDFNPFSSNNYGQQNTQNSKASQKQEAFQQKQQDYVILNQMQNSYKIVKLKTDPSLQSNLLAKKSFDDSQNNLILSSSNQKSVNKQSFNEDNIIDPNNYLKNEGNNKKIDQSLNSIQSIKAEYNQTQKNQEKSRYENQILQSSQTSSQQRNLLQLDGNHNYHRTENKFADSSILIFNQKQFNQKIKDDNMRYHHENQSEQLNSRKSNSQSRRSLSRKSKKQSNLGTLQSDKQNDGVQLQLDKNKININLIQQIQNLQTNIALPKKLDPERKQFYREHFQAKNTLSQNSSGQKQKKQSPIVKTQIKLQYENSKNRKKSPKTELLRGYDKQLALNYESQNGLTELDKSSIYPKSLYDSTARDNHNDQKQNTKYQIEKREIDQHQNDNQALRVSAQTSQPFKKKKKNVYNSQEMGGGIRTQESSSQYPPQYQFNQHQNYPNQKGKHDSDHQKKLTTPKRSTEMKTHLIEWQDTLMKVPQNNEFAQPIQKMNGNPWSDNIYYPHPFLPQQYSQPVYFAPIQNPFPQIQQPFYFGYENKNQPLQNLSISTAMKSQSQNKISQSIEKNRKISQTEVNDIQKRQNELSQSQNNKPFRTVLNMQSQKLQQSYQILQNEFEKKREEEEYQNYNQAQRKLFLKENEGFSNETKNNKVIQKVESNRVSTHSLLQSQSLNLSDGLDFQEVIPVQRNYKSSVQIEQLQHFGQSQSKSISSQYKRETITNSQSIYNQLSNSSLMHNTNNHGFQKDMFVEKAYSRNVNDSHQNQLSQVDENLLSGMQSHQTSQSLIKSVSLKGHILAAKSPKFCNSITFDNQVHQNSSQIESQHYQIPNSNLQQSQKKEDNQNSSLIQSYTENRSNMAQLYSLQQNSQIENPRNYQNQNRNYENQKEQISPQPTIMISQLQSLQTHNKSSVASPNSTFTPATQLNKMKNIINKENPYLLNSQKDTVYSDMNKQESRNPTSEYEKSISKQQQSHLTMQQEQTPEGFQSQYAGDSKSVTVDHRDHQNIQQQNSILINRLSSFKSDDSDIMENNQQLVNISKVQQIIDNQSNIINNDQRFNSQRETGVKTGYQKDVETKIFQRLKSKERGSSFDPQNMKNISKDFKKECENQQDSELTPITNNLSYENYFKKDILNSDQNEENENHQKSLVSDDCRDMILEFKRAKNNNVILNMEKNMKQLQDKIQSKIERQGSKNSQSTYNLPPKSQINKILLQSDCQINQSENILRPVENQLLSKAQDNYQFQINEKMFQQNTQTTLNSCHQNYQLDYQIHQKQLSKNSDPITQLLTKQRSSHILASGQSSQKGVSIFNNLKHQVNEQVYSIEDFKQNSEKSFQKLSDLQSSNSVRQIQNASLDQPLFSKRQLPKGFQSIYSGKEDQHEIYGYYKSSSNLQNSESFNEEVENQISRSLIEVQVKEFLQQPNIVHKLKNADNFDEIQEYNQNKRNMKINIESGSNTGPVYSQSGYEQALGGFLMQTGVDFEESFRDSKSQSRVSMGKLLESNKTIIREMREQNSKESSRQFLRNEHFQ